MTPWPPRASDPSNGRPSLRPHSNNARPLQRRPDGRRPIPPCRSTYSTSGSATPVSTDGLRWFRFLSYLVPVEVLAEVNTEPTVLESYGPAITQRCGGWIGRPRWPGRR
jgi:hypothetical protein